MVSAPPPLKRGDLKILDRFIKGAVAPEFLKRGDLAERGDWDYKGGTRTFSPINNVYKILFLVEATLCENHDNSNNSSNSNYKTSGHVH